MSIAHPIEIANVDVEFVVRDGPTLMGRLTISRGGIDWRPSGASESTSTTWKEFAKWMSG
jgi:hypothetical protein